VPLYDEITIEIKVTPEHAYQVAKTAALTVGMSLLISTTTWTSVMKQVPYKGCTVYGVRVLPYITLPRALQLTTARRHPTNGRPTLMSSVGVLTPQPTTLVNRPRPRPHPHMQHINNLTAYGHK
jgi:hypothetical protein